MEWEKVKRVGGGEVKWVELEEVKRVSVGRRLRWLEWEEVKWVELEEVKRVSVGRRLRGLEWEEVKRVGVGGG